MHYIKIKRVIDIIVSALLLIALAPLFAVLALVIRVKIGSPVIFSQLRPGYKGLVFRMHKFRTMSDAKDQNGELLPDDQRVDKFGLFLRSASLDELPALVNVLKGDMSLVGPRPLLVEYLALYSDMQMKRHDVRPGITGLAQVNGRNSLDWSQKFAFDLEYVESCGFLFDCKILLKTLFIVFNRKGISQGGDIGMEKFRGNNQS